MSISMLYPKTDTMFTRCGSPAKAACDKRMRVEEFVRNLTQRSDRTWTLDSVAEELNISRRHFTDLFRQVTGTTWATYLRRMRIYRAQRLLAETRYSVAAIAMQAGFEDLSSFYRAFQNVIGMPPHRWRSHHSAIKRIT